MKIELISHLNEIAKIMKMTKINERQYKGEYGQLFRRTDFGYIPESHFNRDLQGKEKFYAAV